MEVGDNYSDFQLEVPSSNESAGVSILLAKCQAPPSPDAQASGLSNQALVNQALRGLEPPL